jgi:hypothetical protein
MAWQNQSIFEHNLIELSSNCTSNYRSKPLLGFLLTNIDYIISFYIIGVNGLIQNFLLIQTLICASFREKWSTVYMLVYGITGLILSICLMISVFWNDGYFVIIGFICLILNSSCLWISAILAFERMLMQLFFFKLYGMTSQHAIIISILIFLFVTISYVLSMIFSRISLIIFFFHLITPGIIHIISFFVTFTSIIQRKCYLSEYPMNFSSFIQILSNQGGFLIAPLCIILCIIISIVSIQWCFLLIFNISFFLPPMISFAKYILTSKTNMKKFKIESPCGQLLMKLHF